jgi:hypothetical protein
VKWTPPLRGHSGILAHDSVLSLELRSADCAPDGQAGEGAGRPGVRSMEPGVVGQGAPHFLGFDFAQDVLSPAYACSVDRAEVAIDFAS